MLQGPSPRCTFQIRKILWLLGPENKQHFIKGSSHTKLVLLLLLLVLTVGFETNLNNNAHRKELKYRPLLSDLATDYKEIKFVNLCISCLGIFGTSSNSFLKMCNDSGIDTHHLNFIISKLSTIVIRTTYYIFCMRNKPWCDPELLTY